MSRSLVVALAVLAAVALTVWYFATPTPYAPRLDMASTTASASSSASIVSPATSAGKPATKGSTTNTYKSLLTQSGTYQCDYSQVQSSGQSTNVIYIYGGKLRGEFRTSNNGDSIANLVVYDGHYLYSWKEGSSVGTRSVLTSLSQLPLVIPEDLTSGQIYGTSYESVGWNCHTWLTNKSLLTPPSYVTFR